MTDVVIAGGEYQKMAALDQVLFVLQIFLKLTQIKFEAKKVFPPNMAKQRIGFFNTGLTEILLPLYKTISFFVK